MVPGSIPGWSLAVIYWHLVDVWTTQMTLKWYLVRAQTRKKHLSYLPVKVFSTDLWSWSTTLGNDTSDIGQTIHFWHPCTQAKKLTRILIRSEQFYFCTYCIASILNDGRHLELGQISGWPTSLFWRVILHDHKSVKKTWTGRNGSFFLVWAMTMRRLFFFGVFFSDLV